MFSPGANDPRASVPPNACDSTSVLSSDGGGLWDKPSYIKDARLERGDREKIYLGRRDLASDRAFLIPSQSTSFSSDTGRLHERHDRGERERIFGGRREWSTSKLSAFPAQRTNGPTFSNGSSYSPLSKPYPGRHGFYKENGRYGSSCSRVGDAPLAFLTDDNRGGRRDCELYYATGEAAIGSKDASLVHRTKDLGLHTDKGASYKAGDRMQDSSTTQLEKSTSNCQFGHRSRLKESSNLVSNSPRKGERDSKFEKSELSKSIGISEDDFSQVKNVVDKVAVEGRLGFRSNQLDSCGEDLFISNSTLGSSLKHSSEKPSERLVSISSRRSAFSVGNGFSNELIARLHTPLDTALLSPKSSTQSTVHSSSLGSTVSADNASPKKRPRLGWGQGLAKYEQKKVEGNIFSSAVTCGGSSELPASLSTDDEHTALKTSGKLPSMASSWDSNHNAERKLKSKLCGGLSEKGELFYKSSEAGKIHNEDLLIFNQPGTSQEKAGYEKLERVESSQVQVEKIPTCKPLEPLVVEKRNEVSNGSPRRNAIHESIASLEDVFEADRWAPSCASGWIKQDILNGIEKLELEIDLVEKELLKLDIDGEDNPENVLAASLMNEVEHYKLETCCIAVEISEDPHVSEGTSSHQQHADEPQNLHSSPFEISVDCHLQQSQDEPEDVCIQAVDLENEDKFIPGIEIDRVVGQERASESGFSDENDCIGTKFLSGTIESLLPSNFIKNDLLVDMQNLHLQSVHALLEENQVQSRQAFKPFIHLLPENLTDVKCRHLALHRDVCAWEHDQYDSDGPKEQMLQKLAKRKHLMRFKEQALALKYRALKELWRQEQLGNFHKKDRSKAFRKFESERKNGTAFFTQRFSSRLRPTISGSGKPDAAPDEVKLLSKVVADRCDEHVRSFLKMPAMVLDKKERTYQKFVSKNGLVEDPVSLEQERKTMNPWTLDERQIFLEKFATFNKSFSKIASYLEHKTTADCVVFYYKNQKCEDFEKIRRRHHLKKRRDYSRASASYLATTVFPAGGRNRENNSANVEDIISFALANSSSREVLRHGRAGSHKSIDRVHFGGPSELRSCISGALKISTGTKESKAASDLLAVAAGVASGDIMNPCSSSASVFPPKCGIDSDVFRENSSGQMSFRSNTAPFGESKTSQFLHGRQGNGKSMGEQLESQWSDNEKHCFVDALSLYGKDFRRIAQHIKTKTQGQCKAFFSKSRKRLNLDQIVDRSEAASRALSEADLIAVRPTSNLETVKMEEFVVYVNSVTSHEDLHPGESATMCLEGTKKEPQLPVLQPLFSTDEVKVLSEDEGNRAFAIEQSFENSHHHTPANSPSRHKAGRTLETNEPQCTQLACQSSPTIDSAENHIKKMRVLESEDCDCSPTEVDDVKIQLTGSAMYKKVAVEITTTSCTASSGVVLNEHEHLSKRAKLEADSPSISSSVPPEIPSSNLVAHQVSHAVKPSNAKIAPKNMQLHEKAVKMGGETRSRREATSWTQEEKEIFAETIKQRGKDWAVLQERLPLKSLTQIKTYFQNSKAKLGYAPENVGNGSSQAVCSRKRKTDETDTNLRSFGKLNSQKSGQLSSNDGGMNANSSVMNKDADMSVVAAEQLAFALLAHNSGQVVEDMAAVNDMQSLLRQLCSTGLNTSTAPSKQLSTGGVSESAPSAAHVLGTMQGQMLLGSLHASIQQQLLSAYKQPFSGSNHQQQQSSAQSRVQQFQLAQSASKQQPLHGLHQQQVQSLMPVIQNQQPSQAAQQLVFNHHQPLSMSMQVPASSFLNQKIAYQFSQQHASSPLVTHSNHQLYSQVSHRFQQHAAQQHAAHQQQQKQIIQPQQQLQQVAHQLQNTVSPVMVLQHDPPDSAAHLHTPVVPSYQQSPHHHTSNQPYPLAEQQQQCNLLNQQKSIDYQQVFSPQKQQTVLKHQQQALIQQQKQLHQTPLAQISQNQHQLLHQQQLKNIALQQQLHALNQSQEHQNDTFSLQKLQHLQMKGNQQTLHQNNRQIFNYEETTIAAKQLSNYCLDQPFQTRLTAATVQGSLKRIGSGSDMLNPADVERKKLLVPQLSPEGSQSSQPDSEIFVPAHSRGETCSEGQPGRSGDVKLFGQSLLSQPSSSGSKSSSASPTGSGRLLLRPFSPSLLASPASVPASSMLPPPKFPGSDPGTSSSLDKEICHSPRSRTHHQGTLFATNMANGTASRSGVLESPSGGQEAFSYLTQRPVQMRGLEHGTHGESSTTSNPHIEVQKGPREPCRDEKSLHTISGPVKDRGEQNSVTFLSEGAINQLDAEIDNNCKLSSKSGGQAAHSLSNQGLSQGVLDAIKAITTRQSVQGSACTGDSTQLDDHGLLRGANGLEAPKGSDIVEVPSLQHVLHSYLAASQVLNVSKQTVSDDIVCTTGRSRVITTDHLQLVPKPLPAEPLRSLDSEKVNGSGSNR